jgi:hypothetical protein
MSTTKVLTPSGWEYVSTGLIGPTGPVGTTGPTGPTGAASTVQGPTGATGAQGLQGVTGPQGVQGIVGPTGAQGVTGPQGSVGGIGPTGPQGLLGPTGAQGAQGLLGPTGPTGPQGVQGSQGVQGIVGPTGLQGSQGLIGPTGAQGVQGNQGVVGPTGPTGPIGIQGTAGPTGPQGVKGDTGSGVTIVGTAPSTAPPAPQPGQMWIVGTPVPGWVPASATGAAKDGDGVVWTGSAWSNVGPIRGPQGLLGPTGPQGLQGVTGPGGAAGAAGGIGPTGPAGTQGPTGPQGSQGPQGFLGSTGPTGAQGVQGLLGPTGPGGAQGIQGPTGPAGAQGTAGTAGGQGIQGIQGPTGPQGAKGDTGAQGIQGPTGASGPQGTAGTQGPQGVQGTQGPTGPAGAQGIQGPTGPQGTAGAAGSQGVQGIQGPTGPQGPAGTAGGQGIQGPTGPAGAQGPVGPSTGTAGGDLTGNYPNPQVALAGALNMAQTTTPVAPAAGRELVYVKDDGRLYKETSDGREQLVENHGINHLAPARAATTTNITLSGTQTVDNVALVAGDRVVVKNQTTTTENGVYVVAAGAWTRAADADTAAKLVRGTMIAVLEGSNGKFKVFTQLATLTALGTDTPFWRVLTYVDAVGAFTFPSPTGVGHMVYNINNKSITVWNGFGWDDVIGVTICTSTTRPIFMGPGHQIYETDTGLSYLYVDSEWKPIVGSGKLSTRQVFTTLGAGTWTKPAGCVWIEVEIVAGGGGGGGAQAAAASQHSNAGGGGGGAYAKAVYDASTLGASVTLFVATGGAGGNTAPSGGGTGQDSTFGSLTCTGGIGGSPSSSNINTYGLAGGDGGVVTVSPAGAITIPGSPGFPSFGGGVYPGPGTGASGPLGAGGKAIPTGSAGQAITGRPGTGFGAGGSGAGSSAGGAAAVGGAGANGVVIVTEYYTAGGGGGGAGGTGGAIADGSVTTPKIADGAVTEPKLASAVLANRVQFTDYIQNQNAFGGKKLYMSETGDALFRATERFIVTGSFYNKVGDTLVGAIPIASLRGLFDGNFDAGLAIPAGQYATININANGGTFSGYPYGTFLLSYYNDLHPTSTAISVYCTYAPQTVGWKTLAVTDYVSAPTAKVQVARNAYYGISDITISLGAGDTGGKACTVTSLEWQLDRPSPGNEMPYLDKYKENSLYSDTVWKSGGPPATEKARMTAAGALTVQSLVPATPIIQAWTHGQPDTDDAPGSLHHTVGTGANQAAAGNHTHAGDPGIPYRMAAGAVVVTVSNATAANATVTFPAGRFTQNPIVTALAIGTSVWVAYAAAGANTTAVSLGIRQIDNAAASATVTVHWHAIQMTSGSGSG